jgi:hypothetical protein|uniref:Uncharacterized protein n=1 Tax=viral metagenome TaxID=1070528 RepID=A0A6C0F0H3_9ZZZZ
MNPELSTFIGIMVFYILLSYVIGPVLFYYAFGKTLKSAGNGFIVGSLVSIALWHFAGSKMI